MNSGDFHREGGGTVVVCRGLDDVGVVTVKAVIPRDLSSEASSRFKGVT